ncbi:MAG: hypothetical protein JXD22_01555 [Sedimentisphaerales bacterium]|nr:hypothetical protein [Sedimentisphaerales bacterium]
MAVLIGIDEAGYGPIMGPLVVSAAGFEIPDGLLGKNLWEILSKSCAKNRSGSAGRIIINDSKKVHKGRGDYRLLQRGVLSALVGGNCEPPRTMAELLEVLHTGCGEQFAQYPWYGQAIADGQLSYDIDDIVTAGGALENELADKGCRLLGLWSRPVLVGRFNKMVAAVNNKATVLFMVASELIYEAAKQFPQENLQFVIDKHGGRSHYRERLQQIFPDLNMKILVENETTSSYHLRGPGRSVKIHFLARADDRQLPVALASMASKYLRELFMEKINAYFLDRFPELAATAGYYQDGKRFLGELEGKVELTADERELLVRSR